MKVTNIQPNTNFGVTIPKPPEGSAIAGAAKLHWNKTYGNMTKDIFFIDSKTKPGTYYCQFKEGFKAEEEGWRAYLDSMCIPYDTVDIEYSKLDKDGFAKWCEWMDAKQPTQ